MCRFRSKGDEIPKRVRILKLDKYYKYLSSTIKYIKCKFEIDIDEYNGYYLQMCNWISFLRVNKVWEMQWISYEENWCVISN